MTSIDYYYELHPVNDSGANEVQTFYMLKKFKNKAGGRVEPPRVVTVQTNGDIEPGNMVQVVFDKKTNLIEPIEQYQKRKRTNSEKKKDKNEIEEEGIVIESVDHEESAHAFKAEPDIEEVQTESDLAVVKVESNDDVIEVEEVAERSTVDLTEQYSNRVRKFSLQSRQIHLVTAPKYRKISPQNCIAIGIAKTGIGIGQKRHQVAPREQPVRPISPLAMDEFVVDSNIGENSSMVDFDRRDPQSCRDLFDKMHKKHKCNYCDRYFVRPAEVKRHEIAIHTSERQYKCTHCKWSFKRKDHVMSHIQSVHSNLIYECTEIDCVYTTARLDTLKRHQKTRHNRITCTNNLKPVQLQPKHQKQFSQFKSIKTGPNLMKMEMEFYNQEQRNNRTTEANFEVGDEHDDIAEVIIASE